ncbi:MAG TPA: 50S ribosomal protein L5 [Candidatus Gracilibacteria bacterium]
MTYTSALYDRYNKDIVPALMKELGVKNPMQIPRIEKVVVNVGMGTFLNGSKDYSFVEENIVAITGQKPVVRKARMSVSNFKLREGMPVGLMTTLRGQAAYDFLYKIINVVYPRERGFQGVKKNIFDKDGNCSFGFKEHTVFPEAPVTDVNKTHGLQVTVVTNTDNSGHAFKLMEAFGFPFKK